MKKYGLVLFLNLLTFSQHYSECRVVSQKELQADERQEKDMLHYAMSNVVGQKYAYFKPLTNDTLKKNIKDFLINIIDNLKKITIKIEDEQLQKKLNELEVKKLTGDPDFQPQLLQQFIVPIIEQIKQQNLRLTDRIIRRSVGTSNDLILQITNTLIDSIINGVISIEIIGHSRQPRGLKLNSQEFLDEVQRLFANQQQSVDDIDDY